MTLAERVKEARGSVKMKRAEFARAIGVSKAAMTLIETGVTQALKHDTALAIQRVTKYRAEWIGNGTSPKKIGDDDENRAKTAREEMMLHLFRGLTPEQQREQALKLHAQVEANRQIQQRFLGTPLRTISNEAVEVAFGSVPVPSKPAAKTKPGRKRTGFHEDDPE